MFLQSHRASEPSPWALPSEESVSHGDGTARQPDSGQDPLSWQLSALLAGPSGGAALAAAGTALGHWADEGADATSSPDVASTRGSLSLAEHEVGGGFIGDFGLDTRCELGTSEPASMAPGQVCDDLNTQETWSSVAQRGHSGTGEVLPYLDQIQRAFGPQHDLSSVCAHIGSAGGAATGALTAEAYTHGNHTVFSRYPDLWLAAHEAAHVIQQRAGVGLHGGLGQAGDSYEQHADAVAACVVAGRSAADLLSGYRDRGGSPAVQRKELPTGSQVQSPKDWTVRDRERSSQVWKDACWVNLMAADARQYRRIPERRDFYKWFYLRSTELGFETRWALAAFHVANGADQIAYPTGVAKLGDTFGAIGPELQGMMRTGNQVIFDNVLPKLRRLILSPSSLYQGKNALEWDKQILSEEQQLVQPLYAQMSAKAREQMNNIARKRGFKVNMGLFFDPFAELAIPMKNAKGELVGKPGIVPAFAGQRLEDPDDRWRYGMELGQKFAPWDTGFDPKTDTRPEPGVAYRDGRELATVNLRPNLHRLDAELQASENGHVIQARLATLTSAERIELAYDDCPDGGHYSEKIAQYWIEESIVRAALPAEPTQRSAMQGFMGRWSTARRRAEEEMENLRLRIMMGPKL